MSDDVHRPLKFGEAGPEIQRLREENQHIRGAHEDCRAQWTQMATHNAEQAAEITRLRAELATARRDALEIPAKWHDEQADHYKAEQKKMEALKGVDPGAISIACKFAQAAIQHRHRAAAIRAAAGEVK